MTTEILLEQRTDKQFYIEELGDRYRLHAIPYFGGLKIVDLSKGLLLNGAAYRQNEWIRYLQSEEFKLPNSLIYHAILSSLHQHKDGSQSTLVEKILTMFRKDVKNTITSTYVIYNPSAPDQVYHDHNTANEIVVAATLECKGEYVDVTDDSFKEVTDALLGARDMHEIDAVYRWVSGGKKLEIFLRNDLYRKRDNKSYHRLVLFEDNGRSFVIDANKTVDIRMHAHGVFVHQDGIVADKGMASKRQARKKIVKVKT